MSDDAYRANRAHYGNGKTSSVTMKVVKLENVLEAFKRLGFKVKRKNTKLRTGAWRKLRIAKLNAMWIMLAPHGHVRDRSEEAMQNWCISHVDGLERLQWAESEQLNQCIEALKQWCLRVGLHKEMHDNA